MEKRIDIEGGYVLIGETITKKRMRAHDSISNRMKKLVKFLARYPSKNVVEVIDFKKVTDGYYYTMPTLTPLDRKEAYLFDSYIAIQYGICGFEARPGSEFLSGIAKELEIKNDSSYEEILEKINDTIPDLCDFFHEICGVYFDIHSHNVMRRFDNSLCVIDLEALLECYDKENPYIEQFGQMLFL